MKSNTPQGSFLGFAPIWLWGVLLIQIVMVSFFALATLFNPPPDFDYTTMTYITRNLTAVLALILAILFRSHIALFVALAARFVTDVVDAITVFTMQNTDFYGVVPVVTVLLILPALTGLLYLWKRIRQPSPESAG